MDKNNYKIWFLAYKSNAEIQCSYYIAASTLEAAIEKFYEQNKLLCHLKGIAPNIKYEVSLKTYYQRNRNKITNYDSCLPPPIEITNFVEDIKAVCEKHKYSIQPRQNQLLSIEPMRSLMKDFLLLEEARITLNHE